MNGYELSRIWFDWCFENPEKIKPNHTALYFFCIEHCNRLGWKKKFGLPTNMAKEAIGIKSYGTYICTLNELVEFGFIEMIEKSKNQYSSNIIALSKFSKALDKALDKATVKHTSKQLKSTHQSIDSIDKPITNKQENYTEIQKELLSTFDFSDAEHHYPMKRLVGDFFRAKIGSFEIDNFVEQFRAYREYLKLGDNIKYRYSIANFLGEQKSQFTNGKWLSENWVEKLKLSKPSKQAHSMFGASN